MPRQKEVLHGEKYLLPFPLLLLCLAALCCCLRGSELDKSDLVHSFSGLTADKSQSRLHPAKPLSVPSLSMTREDATCRNSCFGVQGLHLLLVSDIGLSGSYEDPDFDVLRDSVPHGRLLVWLLQAGFLEHETLVCR